MDAWLDAVLRQIILYSLPLLITLTAMASVEARYDRRDLFASWREIRTWGPVLAAIAFHRGMIIAYPRPQVPGIQPAAQRLLFHVLLAVIGAVLYAWSLKHPPAQGLPPLHHWWAKVLMFLNLCMCAAHILPLPGFLVGEWLRQRWQTLQWPKADIGHLRWTIALIILAASPLPDMLLGRMLVFPFTNTLQPGWPKPNPR